MGGENPGWLMLVEISPKKESLRFYIQNFAAVTNLKLFAHVNKVVAKALEENREADKKADNLYTNRQEEQRRKFRV